MCCHTLPQAFFRIGYWASLVVMLLYPAREAHPQLTAPVEERGFTSLTSYDELQTFLERASETRGIKVQPIARTRAGRNVMLVTITTSPIFGSDTAKLRVLLFAQQHGDEPSGKEAMTMLIARAARGELNHTLRHLDLLLIPQMNPDGAELRQRRTADGVDLNRNHVLLTAPETKALHDVYHQWLPQVTVDVHEYSSVSPEWTKAGLLKTADVQLGMLTNTNTSPAISALQHERIFVFMAARMKDQGYSFHEYIVGTPQEYIRHSTTEINDGRQSFGILGSVSFIQEGRKWRSLEDRLERRSRSQLAALEALLDYCRQHARSIQQLVAEERDQLRRSHGHMVPIRMEHVPGARSLDIPIQLVGSGRDSVWRVHPYRSKVTTLKAVLMPRSYIIESEDSSVSALLARHHVRMDTIKRDITVRAIAYSVDSISAAVVEGDTLPWLHVVDQVLVLPLKPGDLLVPTSQLQSRLATILLEPESQWGLTRYREFPTLHSQRLYPIKRLLD